jgi:hypothetical protein
MPCDTTTSGVRAEPAEAPRDTMGRYKRTGTWRSRALSSQSMSSVSNGVVSGVITGVVSMASAAKAAPGCGATASLAHTRGACAANTVAAAPTMQRRRETGCGLGVSKAAVMVMTSSEDLK